MKGGAVHNPTDPATLADGIIPVAKLTDGAARQVLQTDAAGTGAEWTDNVKLPGTLRVDDVTESVSKDTGSAVLEGGLGVEKSVQVGIDLVVAAALAKAKNTFRATNTQLVSAPAVTIATTGAFGSFVLVTGEITPTTNTRFLDLVLTGYNVPPTVVASHNVMGAPDARTYTQVNGALQLTMAANTYDVSVLQIFGVRPL